MLHSDRDTFDKLRLTRSANIGPVSYTQLINRFGTAGKALEAIPHLATRGGGRSPVLASPDLINREIARAAQLEAHYLFLGDPAYPDFLAQIDTAPPALLYRGDLSLFGRPSVAMVGARNASAAACRFARTLAQDLGAAGAVVVSGLARGIDTAAHVGSLDSGTIAVIASGIDVSFPPENAGLQEEIARRGLLLAEQPPGTEPRARHFPYRNRIIAGLAAGTVVVEAAPRSGSLITARLANEAGREVMAVPGSPLDPRAQGCNSLIREGATLIQSAADIMEAIGPMDYRMVRQSRIEFDTTSAVTDPSDPERAAIHSLLSLTAVHVDELVRQSGLSAAAVQLVLLELELGGRLERHAGGRVSLV